MRVRSRNEMTCVGSAISRSIVKVAIVARTCQSVATPECLLGWSLGVIYLWFGALKLTNMSPIVEFLRQTYPGFATGPRLHGLALYECTLGVMLLLGVWKRLSALAAIFHLVGTLSVLIFAPQAVFRPAFPILTMEGEFVVKNLVLLSAAGTLWLTGREQGTSSPAASVARRLSVTDIHVMQNPTEYTSSFSKEGIAAASPFEGENTVKDIPISEPQRLRTVI